MQSARIVRDNRTFFPVQAGLFAGGRVLAIENVCASKQNKPLFHNDALSMSPKKAGECF
jgi:hypothetical protein